MIKSHEGTVTLEGTKAEIEADLCVVMKVVREEILVQEYGLEGAEKRFSELVEDSKKSTEDIDNEYAEMLKAATREMLSGIVELFFGGGSRTLALAA